MFTRPMQKAKTYEVKFNYRNTIKQFTVKTSLMMNRTIRTKPRTGYTQRPGRE